MGTQIHLWTDHLQAEWFRDKHQEFISKLNVYDECLRPTIATINGDRLFKMLIDIINRGSTTAFRDDVEHLCNKFTGWGSYENKINNPQSYYSNLSIAMRVAIIEFMPVTKEYIENNRRIRKVVTQ